jgi:hypothetical protein
VVVEASSPEPALAAAHGGGGRGELPHVCGRAGARRRWPGAEEGSPRWEAAEVTALTGD